MHSGEVVSRGLIPVWVIPLLLFMCILLSGAAYMLYPIVFPTPTPTQTPVIAASLTPSATPKPGAPVFDEWCIYPADQPPLQFKNCPNQIIITIGKKVVIQWQVSNTDEQSFQLSPLGNRKLNGREEYVLLETTDFKLSASNHGVSWEQTINVIVELPTATITPPTPATPDLSATARSVEATSTAAELTRIAAMTAAAPMFVSIDNVLAQPDYFSGNCPVDISFSASITVDKAGTVVYNWLRSDGATGSRESVTFNSAGTQEVSTIWSSSESGSYWVEVHILDPVDGYSSAAYYTLSCVTPVPPVDLNLGLMAYYPFSGDASDWSTNGNFGYVNGPYLTYDRQGNPNSAYNFDGQDDSINIPNSLSLNMTGQISLVAWVNPYQQKTQDIIRKGQSAQGAPYSLALSGTGDVIFQLTLNTQPVEVRFPGYSTYQWMLIVATYEGANLSLYVNGVLVANQTVNGAIITDSSELLIGTRLNLPADTFFGDIDEVRIYDRVLSQEEINALYQP